MAVDIGEKRSTVNQWRTRGSIPTRYWQVIIDKAALRGFTFTMEFIHQAVASAELEAKSRG